MDVCYQCQNKANHLFMKKLNISKRKFITLMRYCVMGLRSVELEKSSSVSKSPKLNHSSSYRND